MHIFCIAQIFFLKNVKIKEKLNDLEEDNMKTTGKLYERIRRGEDSKYFDLEASKASVEAVEPEGYEPW